MSAGVFERLEDIFAMEVEVLTLVKIGTMTTVQLRLAGGSLVFQQGNPGESWTDVLAGAVALALKNAEAHHVA